MVKSSPNLMRDHINKHLKQFNNFHALWMDDRDEFIADFKKDGPLLGDWKAKVTHYDQISEEIEELPTEATIGPITLNASNVKQSLQVESRSWKVML